MFQAICDCVIFFGMHALVNQMEWQMEDNSKCQICIVLFDQNIFCKNQLLLLKVCRFNFTYLGMQHILFSHIYWKVLNLEIMIGRSNPIWSIYEQRSCFDWNCIWNFFKLMEDSQNKLMLVLIEPLWLLWHVVPCIIFVNYKVCKN